MIILLFLALVVVVLLVKGPGQRQDRFVAQWAQGRGLVLTAENRPMVDWYLRVASSLRTWGALGGAVLAGIVPAALGFDGQGFCSSGPGSSSATSPARSTPRCRWCVPPAPAIGPPASCAGDWPTTCPAPSLSRNGCSVWRSPPPPWWRRSRPRGSPFYRNRRLPRGPGARRRHRRCGALARPRAHPAVGGATAAAVHRAGAGGGGRRHPLPVGALDRGQRTRSAPGPHEFVAWSLVVSDIQVLR